VGRRRGVRDENVGIGWDSGPYFFALGGLDRLDIWMGLGPVAKCPKAAARIARRAVDFELGHGTGWVAKSNRCRLVAEVSDGGTIRQQFLAFCWVLGFRVRKLVSILCVEVAV